MSDRELRAELMQLTLGYWRSQLLFTAQRLGVFEALQGGSRDAAEVAAACGAAPGHVARLLEACATIGLVAKVDGRFRNGELAERFLVPGAPQWMGDWVRFMAYCYEPWGRLTDTMRAGRPVLERPGTEAAARAYTRTLILAMRDYAAGPGSELAAHLDLAGRRRLLDVAGGPGTYAIQLARVNPQLAAEVFDLPEVVPVTAELIAEAGLAGRVTTRAGSYLTDDFGHGYDVVLLSNMMHQEDPDGCRMLLRKAHAALEPGGLLVIQSAFIGAGKAGQTWAALQSVQLALFYEGGRNYSVDEMRGLALECGFADPVHKRMSLVSATSLLLATRPGA